MIYAVVVLLCSSLTLGGLLSIWAATSSRHWFLRTAVFLGCLLLLLLIPAYEPFAAFLLQGAVVAIGVQIARRWRRKRDSAERGPLGSRFSLKTLLLVVPPLAVLSAVAANLPTLNFQSWQNVVLIGCASGAITLVALWMVKGNWPHWILRMLVGSLFTLLLAFLLAVGDWFLWSFSITQSWPPPEQSILIALGYNDDAVLIWLFIGPVVMALIATVLVLFLLLWGVKSTDREFDGRSLYAFRQLAAGAALILLAIPILVPSLDIYYRLLTPLPVPSVQLPKPNGYDDFVAAGHMFPANPIVDGVNFDVSTATVSQLRSAVNEVSAAIDRVELGLTQPILKQQEYSSDNGLFGDIQRFRSLARGFSAQGTLYEQNGKPDSAVDCYLDLINFGSNLGNGGLIVDEMVGVACARIGSHHLYEVRAEASVESCRRVMVEIEEVEKPRTSFEDAIRRDRIFSEHVYGWHGHLIVELDETSDLHSGVHDSYRNAYLRYQATLRLLRLEYALRVWQAEHDEYPASLTEMTGELLSDIPLDPFDPDGKPLRYIRTDDGYVLYSVGGNGIDDGGVPPDEEPYRAFMDQGDVRLDAYFAAEKEERNETVIAESQDGSETEE